MFFVLRHLYLSFVCFCEAEPFSSCFAGLCQFPAIKGGAGTNTRDWSFSRVCMAAATPLSHNNHNTYLHYPQVIEPLLVHDLVVHLLMYPPPPATGGRRLPPDQDDMCRYPLPLRIPICHRRFIVWLPSLRPTSITRASKLPTSPPTVEITPSRSARMLTLQLLP